ncbi:aldehyde dehydrogenase family protein [Brevibacterium jeotgali]|uniref:Acyl-CoA reductase n=1 Tax=Brevibacterium jeotgali TaxID=1262550 RepID=A0A2H1L730_9MICO|nr:aldehyde dehydrogenase family protein [Brevibacterium jeotgali]TWC02266.1 acyl-CoA reductase-like NAD-dependent aldehyde dehydrogenase [Brevibacterium jeotgali]SMY12682.1 Acyl-CoA reductase [Brevibacterium jeotgali]
MFDESHTFTLTIAGEPIAGAADPLTVVNPATAQPLAEAPSADHSQLNAAVTAARDAFTTWRKRPWEERRDAVLAYAAVLEAEADSLARLLTAEQGKPLAAARGEVARAIDWTRSLADLEIPTRTAVDDDTHTARVRHVPIGVVAGIVPWNFPVTLAMWKIAPALLTGNTVVLKPSPFTPLTGLMLGELSRGVLPPGVLNVITGDDDLGPALTAHPGVDKIAFTGSTATGKAVMASAAADLKRVTLELGGNDAAVILPDADVEELAPALFWACFANTSQYCLATKRVYVHEDVHESFLRALVQYADSVVVGDGAEAGTQMGPLQNRKQYERVLEVIAESEAAGHTIAYRGTRHPDEGFFIGPVIVDQPPEDAWLVQEEPFGPIVPVLTYTDVDDVVERVNASRYGLGGSVWGTDVDRAVAVAERIESGVVWVNEIHRLSPQFPLAGHRESGIGRENGIEGLLEYCSTQVIAVSR